MLPPSSLVIYTAWGLMDLTVRAIFSTVLLSDCFAIDLLGDAISPCEALPILATLS